MSFCRDLCCNRRARWSWRRLLWLQQLLRLVPQLPWSLHLLVEQLRNAPLSSIFLGCWSLYGSRHFSSPRQDAYGTSWWLLMYQIIRTTEGFKIFQEPCFCKLWMLLSPRSHGTIALHRSTVIDIIILGVLTHVPFTSSSSSIIVVAILVTAVFQAECSN